MNTIAFNDGDGVFVESGTNNTILRNSFSRNDELGIDLGPDYGTVNDLAPDGDAGANGLQPALKVVPDRVLRHQLRSLWARRGRELPRLGPRAGRRHGHDEGTTQIANAVGDQLVTMTATSVDAPFSRTLVNATSEFSRCEEVA